MCAGRLTTAVTRGKAPESVLQDGMVGLRANRAIRQPENRMVKASSLWLTSIYEIWSRLSGNILQSIRNHECCAFRQQQAENAAIQLPEALSKRILVSSPTTDALLFGMREDAIDDKGIQRNDQDWDQNGDGDSQSD